MKGEVGKLLLFFLLSIIHYGTGDNVVSAEDTEGSFLQKEEMDGLFPHRKAGLSARMAISLHKQTEYYGLSVI